MNSKWIIIILIATIISLLVAVIAVLYAPFGAALHDFGIFTLGPAGMAFLAWIFQVPHIWGAESLLYGFAVTVATILLWTVFWTLALKRVWGKAKVKLGITQATATATPTNYPTMTTPTTVVVKEVPVSTTEKKEEA
jgi:hypothetical protein